MSHNPIFNLVAILARLNVKHAIVAPGSRNAPLSIALSRHPEIKVYSVPEERSAAYIAMGCAQISGKPVVLVTTSGTAALNVAPAVAESFYQKIPLIIFTADRPPEWIGQLDGQSIEQAGIFKNYIKGEYSIQADLTHKDALWHMERLTSEAVNLAHCVPYGPVHINAPFREPFYPDAEDNFSGAVISNVRVIREVNGDYGIGQGQWEVILQELKSYKRCLIIAGQSQKISEMVQILSSLSEKQQIPIITDIISNYHEVVHCIKHHDIFLKQDKRTKNGKLNPDLVLTFGDALISKNLKEYLRNKQNLTHWHVQPAGKAADIFKSLKKVIRCTPQSFFSRMSEEFDSGKIGKNFFKAWQESEQDAVELLNKYISRDQVISELKVMNEILRHLPGDCELHLGNSMPVRYANMIGINSTEGISVFSNRGTSGIDGILSTAVGHALYSTKMNIIILGDMSFFYDRNALWNKIPKQNLRIIVINNYGGGIFKHLKESNKQPEVDELFVTEQEYTVNHAAEEYGFEYLLCKSVSELEKRLPEFFGDDSVQKILEIPIDLNSSINVYNQFINENQQ
jgi:2-succinyl-5-enolpyruvyl-6-hydroxy-3-cyclohexene-1-carboxylate synthase